MCNAYRLTTPIEAIRQLFSDAAIILSFPEGVPNLPPREDVRITDMAPIVRLGSGGAELVQRRWSWPGPGGKPVYNFRSEGRSFDSGRCLIVADGFYEFTGPADPAKKRKDKWLFTRIGEPLLCIAGIWRSLPGGAEAFTMLTTEPGGDVAPYHDRQVAVLGRDDWRERLYADASTQGMLKPLPIGSLAVERTG